MSAAHSGASLTRPAGLRSAAVLTGLLLRPGVALPQGAEPVAVGA